MKNKLFALFLATMAALEVYACFNPPVDAEAQTSETVTTEADYINMNDVVGYEATDYGLMLHFSDGTGYWWER